MGTQDILALVFRFLAKAFGFVIEQQKLDKRTKGLKVKNEILEQDIARGDETEQILKDTLKKDEQDVPHFDYSKYRR